MLAMSGSYIPERAALDAAVAVLAAAGRAERDAGHEDGDGGGGREEDCEASGSGAVHDVLLGCIRAATGRPSGNGLGHSLSSSRGVGSQAASGTWTRPSAQALSLVRRRYASKLVRRSFNSSPPRSASASSSGGSWAHGLGEEQGVGRLEQQVALPGRAAGPWRSSSVRRAVYQRLQRATMSWAVRVGGHGGSLSEPGQVARSSRARRPGPSCAGRADGDGDRGAEIRWCSSGISWRVLPAGQGEGPIRTTGPPAALGGGRFRSPRGGRTRPPGSPPGREAGRPFPAAALQAAGPGILRPELFIGSTSPPVQALPPGTPTRRPVDDGLRARSFLARRDRRAL